MAHQVGGAEEEGGAHDTGDQGDDQALHQLAAVGRALGHRRCGCHYQPQRERADRHRQGPLDSVQAVDPEEPAVAERVGDGGDRDRQHHLEGRAQAGAAGVLELGERHADDDQRGDPERTRRNPAAAEGPEPDAGDDHQLPGRGDQPAGARLAGPGERRVEEPEADGRPEQPRQGAGAQGAQDAGQPAAHGHQRHQRDDHEQEPQTGAPHPGAAQHAHPAVEHKGGGEAGGREQAQGHRARHTAGAPVRPRASPRAYPCPCRHRFSLSCIAVTAPWTCVLASRFLRERRIDI